VNDPLRFLRKDFDALEEYTPVKPLDVLAREIGVPAGQLVKLDANENLYGPIEAIREAVARADFHIYPDPGQTQLRAAIAEYCGVSPEQVVAGSGADDLIDIILRLVEPEAVVVAPPTFGMYSFLARIDRARVVEVARRSQFAVDIEAIGRAVSEGARIVFLASPNNPSGNVLSTADVEALCRLEAMIVIDEAYVEFSGGTAVPLLSRHPNLIVLRTFSKWAGLAGLRVGYSLSHPALASRMMAIKQPYNVNVAADVAARTALEHRGEILETVRCIVTERDRMARLAAETGWLQPYPSESNFVLFQVNGRSARDVRDRLRARGVLVRYYDTPELAGCIRISAGRPEDTDRLLDALRSLEAS
jgi:histidinol-phosphate aminotransferase